MSERGPIALVAVEDGEVRNVARRLFEREGQDVVGACDGAEALVRLVGTTFDVVVCDASMPHNGARLVPWLLLSRPATGVVVLTGDAERLDDEPLAALATRLEKPFHMDALREAVRLARGAAARRLALTLDLERDPAIATVLLPQGVVWMVNGAWRHFARANGYARGEWGLGENYLEVCRRTEAGPDRDDAQRAVDRIGSALAGEKAPPFAYPCHAPRERRWFEMAATPEPIDGVGLVRVRHVKAREPS